MNLTGNTIFITGGGSGIGRGLAEELHKRGNKVIISGRRKSHLDAVAKANPGIEAIELDIADPGSIKTVAKKLITVHPDLNVLITLESWNRIRQRASSTTSCSCRPSRPIFWALSA